TAASSLPDHPGAVAPRFHAVEGDLVLEGVHRAPEAVVAVDAEELLLDQALEGALDELVALLDVVEDVVAKNEVAAVDEQLLVRHAVDARGQAVCIGVHRVEAVPSVDAREAGRDALGLEVFDHAI